MGGSTMEAAPDSPPLLQVAGLTKRFGSLTACDAIDLSIGHGEIHALLGENGAGKSTLVKMLFGALAPDEGTVQWDGEPVLIKTPAEARRLGIGMIFQHFSLFEALSVSENIALGLDRGRGGPQLNATIRDISREYGLPLDPRASITDLSVGERQRVEIVRCLLQNPKLIIMDEPTSVLTPQEADILFVTLRRLVANGVSILYITHRLTEVVDLADKATILRRGKIVGSADPKAESVSSLARLMIGEEVAGSSKIAFGSDTTFGDDRLVLSDASLAADGQFGVALKSIDLRVRRGEIVGIAGVAGNGQHELFELISGERLSERANAVRIDGSDAGRLGVNQRRRLGAAFVPEERIGHSAAANLSLSDNVILTHHAVARDVNRNGWISRKAAQAVEERVGEAFDVRRAHADPLASSLSGGNLQKFVIGREVDREPGVLVVNQPTWGVDAGAARRVRDALAELARNGSAVLVISQDLDEIFEIADTIAVISDGRMSEARPAEKMSMEEIGLLMGGVHGEIGNAA
ncbi:MAG TPA: ABC transporter ATP-binding protein [Afifellaceae bacterium]|nr:ABC transporter ATP-binding protein [Afifellaceae bacterium]